MRLESIQIGSARPSIGKQFQTTGIYKEPVETAQITPAGVVGDQVVDTINHGGPDQAVYLYTRDDYRFWEEQLGRPLPGGTFGENLTLSGVESAAVVVGDRFELGDVVIEATAARIPCVVFQHKMAEPSWVKRFREVARPGVYCRVLSEGSVTPGIDVGHVAARAQNITVLETFELYYDRTAGVERLERALASPIAERTRGDIMRRLGRS